MMAAFLRAKYPTQCHYSIDVRSMIGARAEVPRETRAESPEPVWDVEGDLALLKFVLTLAFQCNLIMFVTIIL